MSIKEIGSWIPGLGPVQAHNGRINLLSRPSAGGSPHNTQFSYSTIPDKSINDLVRGNWEHTPLSIQFFSIDNINHIQNTIKNTIYKESDFKWMIDDQSIDELKIIMRAQFLQYAQNRPDNIDKQINTLNRLVIEWCVPRIMSEIQQYMFYLNDITHMPHQMSLPVSMSSAGTKSFPLGNFM
jgi:hypothetical protein